MNRTFWFGVLIGVGGTWLYHRMMGLPGKAAK